MQKAHIRIDTTLAQLKEVSSPDLEEKLYRIMPSYVFRLITFVEDNYEKRAATIYCFNFIPSYFSVVVGRNEDMQFALEDIANLNPGLGWEKASTTHPKQEDLANNRITQEFTIVHVPPRSDVNEIGEKIRLSALDIRAVLRTLERFEFQVGAVGMFYNDNPMNPCFISPGGMIFIYGNQHFGTMHINERHGYFTDGAEWRKESSGRVFLDNPSKFPKNSIPFNDYGRIADELYKPANLCPSKAEAIFEKYTGVCDYGDEKNVTFHLLVYRNTKIVHTFYPQSKKFNRVKRNILNYKKGKLTVDHKIFYNLLIGKQPYFNSEYIIRYIVIVLLNSDVGNRQIWIETTTLNGNPMYCVKVQETSGNRAMDGESFFRGLEFADFSGMEKWIKQFDEALLKQAKEA